MSKNTTRKGLAFGAGLALIASGFAGVAPANAVVNDNAVSLLPTTGTQYSMVVDNVFDLRTTISSTLFSGVTGTLKFLVEDPDEVLRVDVNINGTTLDNTADINNIAAGGLTAIAIDADRRTITFTGTHTYAVGDRVTIALATVTNLDADKNTADAAAINTTHTVTAVSTTASFSVVLAAPLDAGTSAIAHADTTVTFVKTAETGNATRAELVAAPLGSRSVLGKDALVSERELDGSFVVTAANVSGTLANAPVLRLVSTAATAATVKVTAWVDEGAGNDEIDPTEIQSSQRTINFVPWAGAGVTLNLAQPVAGLATWNANFAFDPAINASQITASRLGIAVGVIENGTLKLGASGTTVNGGGTAFTAGTSATYNAANNFWGLGTSGTAGVAATITYDPATGNNTFRAGYTYVAQVMLDGAPFGSVVSRTVGSAVSDGVSAVASALNENVRLISGQNYAVRASATAVSSSVTATSKVTKNTVAVANAPVVVTITRNALDSKSTITAGGKSLTSTTVAGAISFDAVTDASGVVSIAITNSQSKAADKITVSVSQAGQASSGTTTFEWLAVDNSAAKVGSATSAGEDRVATTAGGSYTINYQVADQFGAPFTSNLRLLVEYTPIGLVAGAAQTGVVRSVPVTGATVPVAITDTSTIVGSYNVTAKLQRLNATTGNFDAAVDTHTTVVHVQSNVTPAAVTVASTVVGTPALEAKDFAAVDVRANLNQLLPGYTADGYTISGVVTNAAGAGIAGVNVTVSAEGSAFFVDGQAAGRDVYGVGSVVVTTNANGAYTVRLYSQRAGKFKVNASIGALTATTATDLTFPAAAVGTGAVLTVTAPAAVAPGSTFNVVAKLVDKWGNPVAAVNGASSVLVVASYTGPGIVVGTMPTQFNALGELVIPVLVGANDRGVATVTVRYDGNTGSATNLNDFTVQRSITVGDVVPGAGTVRGWTKFLDATDELKIYARDLVGQGKVQFMVNGNELAWIRATSAADSKINVASDGMVRSVFVSDMLVGKNVIEIYVDGVRIDRRIFTR